MKHTISITRRIVAPAQAQTPAKGILNYWFCWGWYLGTGGRSYEPKCGEDFEV